MWRLSITLDSVGAREGFVLYNVEFIEELMHMACGFFYKELNIRNQNTENKSSI